MDKTFFIETWGCQMNDLDSQRLSGHLKLRGYKRVDSEDDAGLILLNTCSIRDKSEQKVYSRLGELKIHKQRGARIGICGCVAQQEGEGLLSRAPFLDFVIGPGNVGSIDEVLDGRRRVAVDFPENRVYDYLSVDRPSTVRAQVTVIEGCNKNCTFCIVPTTRGREISRPLADIVAEVRHAVGTGHVEIELLGQTVNAYRCPTAGSSFGDLLHGVAGVRGVERVRFMTSHPAEVSADMIEAMRANPKICRYLHLPVQSGSSRILRRMKRLYTRERYLEIIGAIRAAIPEMRFSTDLIVGFPGETEEDFQQTLSLMETVRYGSLFAFKYSPRPGTPAVRLTDVVDDQLACERIKRVFERQEIIERDTLRSYVGKTVEVLVEGPSRNEARVLAGRTDDNWTVNFTGGPSSSIGSLIPVRVVEALHHTLRGEVAP